MDTEGGPVVVLMCGLAGSGKTTYAQGLERDGFVRLSIDEEVWRRWGRYGRDYPVDRYAELQRQAERHVRDELERLVRQGRDVVVDVSMWRRRTRDRYKALIERAGGRWRLVYLRASPELLRRRLRTRSAREDANAQFPITDAILERYLRDFEAPDGEGEETVDVAGAELVERVRRLCLALPEATERLSHGEPTWFVRDKKTFVMFADRHHDDRVGFVCAAPPGAQEALVGGDPDRFYYPPYVGHRGWVGVRLDVEGVDWDEIGELVVDAYRTIAPRRLVALLDSTG